MRKHEAMLQMYGEKAEEAEGLKLDIQDLKSMYRQQVIIHSKMEWNPNNGHAGTSHFCHYIERYPLFGG